MGSRAYALKLLRDARASYWFLPLMLVVVSQALAMLTLWLDHSHPGLAAWLPTTLEDTEAAGARSLLSLMASSVIGVAGVMFSMTMVAVSFASGNFGPRLIGNFMRDRGNQWSLGVMIATFVYCLQILRAVRVSSDIDGFVPHLSLIVALGLTLLSVLVMIFFVHHVPETINVGNITAGLGHRLEAAVRAEIAEASGEHVTAPPQSAALAQPNLGRSGYVQSLDLGRLAQVSRDRGWQVRLRSQPGDFVSADTPVLDVHGAGRAAGIGEEDLAALRACFALGDNRTEDQNPLFLVDQLVEMTARALSPGVNDPFTARDCLNRMYAALDQALGHDGGLPVQETGPMGRRRLTFERLLETSFAAALPYVTGDAMVTAHMGRLIAQLKPAARSAADLEALERLSARLQDPEGR